jgi:hypothetical protein
MERIVDAYFDACRKHDVNAVAAYVAPGGVHYFPCAVVPWGGGPNRRAVLARARSASIPRSRGSADVINAPMSARDEAATSSTARSKAARLARDGLLNPLSFLTN